VRRRTAGETDQLVTVGGDQIANGRFVGGSAERTTAGESNVLVSVTRSQDDGGLTRFVDEANLGPPVSLAVGGVIVAERVAEQPSNQHRHVVPSGRVGRPALEQFPKAADRTADEPPI